MNDVHATFLAAVEAATEAGEPLNAVAGHVYREGLDALPNAGEGLPALVLTQIGPPEPVDAMRGSRWTIHDGEILARIYVAHDPRATRGWEDSRTAARVIADAFESVLVGLRSSTSDDNPAACWNEMAWEPVDEGGGPVEVNGRATWCKTYRLRFRFRRYRAA